MTQDTETTRYHAVDLRNVADMPQWGLIESDVREAVEVPGEEMVAGAGLPEEGLE